MIEVFKSAYAHASETIHLNNAGIAPWPKQTLEAVTAWSAKLAQGGTSTVGFAFDETEKTRASLAEFLGTRPEQIAFFTTCATAISQVALGFPLKAGDEIVVWDQEYPSNFHPWKIAAERAGAKLVVAKSGSSPDSPLATPFANIEAVTTPRTRIIAISWVQYRSGAQTDLKALAQFARERGIFTCVDIIQGFGANEFHFDSSGLDAVCGGAHKWLTSPLSLGFLALRAEHSELLSPIMVGAMTYGGPDIPSSLEAKMRTGVQKFEPGGRQMLEMLGLGQTLELFKKVGISAIAREAERLSNSIADGLRSRGYQVHSPHGEKIRGAILNFSPTSSSPLKTFEEIEQTFAHHKITFSKRSPGIRLSPHAFNRDEEIEKVLQALERPRG
jgi:cysteine desulfurase / selenocysteine lyase